MSKIENVNAHRGAYALFFVGSLTVASSCGKAGDVSLNTPILDAHLFADSGGPVDARSQANAGGSDAKAASSEVVDAQGSAQEKLDAAGADGPRFAPQPDACGDPPRMGLVLWLSAEMGVTTDADNRVSAWANAVGTERATQATASRQPFLIKNAINGHAVLRFDGNPDLPLDPQSDILTIPVTVDQATQVTLALVNATTQHWTSDPQEWCHRGTDTGCSSTYAPVFGWEGKTSWGGVFLNARDDEVGFRFGPGNGLDSHCFVGDNVSAADPCMKYPRPQTLGTAFSMTVAIHDEKTNRIFVQGQPVSETPIAHGVAAVDADLEAHIGNGVFAHNNGGDVAQVLAYNRALTDIERQSLEAYLACLYFPKAMLRE